MKVTKVLALIGPISLAVSAQIYNKCNHEYVYSHLINESDCTNHGSDLYICKYCQDEKVVTLDLNPNKHDWDEGEIILQPTCVETGIKRSKCKRNPKHVADLKISCVPHDLSDHHDHEFPTFRLNGLKEHYICPVCKNYLLADGETIVSYSDLIIKKYDSTRIDFVENEIKELSYKYNKLEESDIVYIKNIYLDINTLNEIEKYYLKKERNEVLRMDYYDSFLMIVNRYNQLFIN